VATCGTSFGGDHIKVLRRVLGDDTGLGEVVFTFDPDAAGQKAAMRAFTEEQRFAAQTYVAVGPDGLDPCDLRLAKGDDAVRRMIDSKKPMFEFMIKQVLSQYNLDTVEGRVAALRAAAPVVSDIRDPSLRPGYTRELARMLGMELSEVTRAVSSARSSSTPPSAQSSGSGNQAQASGQRGGADAGPRASGQPPVADGPSLVSLPTDHATRLERDALMAMLQYPAMVGVDLARRATQTAFANQSLAVVRDGIATTLDAMDSPDWLAQVAHEVPAPFSMLVTELGVAPIPERSEKELTAYVRGVTSSLIERDLLRRKADLLGRLQRADPEQRDAYTALQRELVQIEADRRKLRDE
jgi:DNA primase